MGWMLVIAAGYAFIFWRTDHYLKPKPMGRRARLQITVRDGRIHYKGKPDVSV